jgi:hypothetical protein
MTEMGYALSQDGSDCQIKQDGAGIAAEGGVRGDAFIRAYRLALGGVLIFVLWTLRHQAAEFVRFVLSMRGS